MSRIMIRLKAILALTLFIFLFWLPAVYGLKEFPWRWIGDEYSRWWAGVKDAFSTLRTGEQSD